VFVVEFLTLFLAEKWNPAVAKNASFADPSWTRWTFSGVVELALLLYAKRVSLVCFFAALPGLFD
jgi:hypothetical protein